MTNYCICGSDDPTTADSVEALDGAAYVASVVVLAVINLVVVFGNILVIAAVFTTRKLRTVTNTFIISLAVSDFLLGIVILPFSISKQVVKYWMFGEFMCTSWLAFDVWLSTASILNLCVISFDRYIAITRPIQYPSILSSRRAKVLTAGVWVLAFAICLPPLVKSPDNSMSSDMDINENTTLTISTDATGVTDTNPYTYYTYSQNYSMFLLYTNTTSLNISSSSVFENFSTTDDDDFVNTCQPEAYCLCQLENSKSYTVYSALGSFFVPMLVMVFFYIRIYTAAVRTATSMRRGVLSTRTTDTTTGYPDEMVLRIHTGGGRCTRDNDQTNGSAKSRTTPNESPIARKRRCHCGRVPCGSMRRDDSRNSNLDTCDTRWNKSRKNGSQNPIECRPGEDDSPPHTKQNTRTKLVIKTGKFTSKLHNRKFKRETKAAKTLAIIVGAFILCWLPFFTIYIISPFHDKLISEILFDVLFWLGYCNSALNPCIYALCARDFREAFRRILCRPCRARRMLSMRHASDLGRYPGTTNTMVIPVSVPNKESESISDT